MPPKKFRRKMPKQKPAIIRLLNGGIKLTKPELCKDVNYTFSYEAELARHREFEKGKMLKELKAHEGKTQAKGQRKKELVDRGGQLVDRFDAMTSEEWQVFMAKTYPLNTSFLEDLDEFEKNGSMFSDLPNDIEGFTNNGTVPLENRLGFRAHDGSFWSYQGVELNGNDLAEVFGKGTFNKVVVQAYEKRAGGRQVFQILHTHDEPREYWGFGSLFVAPPGGRGGTLNGALTELNEETHYQLESNVSSVRITGYMDEIDMQIRHYFVEVEGARALSKKDHTVKPTFFESFALKNDPKNKSDHVKYLVPRRGGHFDAEEVFKAQVLLDPRTVEVYDKGKPMLAGSRVVTRRTPKRHRVYVDVAPILTSLKVKKTPETQLLRFRAATRADIYTTMLQLALKK